MGISQVAWGVDLSTPLSKAVAVLLTLLHLQLKYLGFTFDRSPFKVACKIEIQKKNWAKMCYFHFPAKQKICRFNIYIVYDDMMIDI